MVLLGLTAVVAVVAILLGSWISRRSAPARGSLMFWVAMLAKVLGGILLVVVFAGLLIFFFARP